MIKSEYKLENYLKVNMPHYIVRAIAKLRTSTHNLAIETGRYTRPRLPPEKRICKFCNNDAPEDEKHFLLDCPFYADNRVEMMQVFPENVLTMSGEEKITEMMRSEKEAHIYPIGIFIIKSLSRRKNKAQSDTLDKPINTNI